MTAYCLLSGLYFVCIAYSLFLRRNKYECEMEEGLFIDKTHTDTMKGIAAIGIVISHIAARLIDGTGGLIKLYMWAGTSLGGIGVDLFFFASGYGNYYSTKRLMGARKKIIWLVKRCVNIVITYLICYIITSLVLRFFGQAENINETIRNILDLRMPLSLTWYLKIQILLYIVLTISLLFKKQVFRVALIVGLSLVLTLFCYIDGFPAQWWKSTMCFCIGYIVAEYKSSIYQLINNYRKQAWWISVICFAVLYVVTNPFDSFFIKVFGNVILLISIMIIVEIIGYKSIIWEKIGNHSLEIYLIHIALCAWFLKELTPSNLGVICVVALTFLMSIIAKAICNILSI